MQENQKTVVAFVAGLLIGGLLVWVFGASSGSAPEEAHDHDHDHEHGATEVTDTMSDTEEVETPVSGRGVQVVDTVDEVPLVEVTAPLATRASLGVLDQDAGSSVAIQSASFPTTDGWIVVRESTNGEGGSILGAARYSTGAGLIPESVTLLRATEAGQTYQVLFFTENGDLVFDLRGDAPISGTEVFFTAR